MEAAMAKIWDAEEPTAEFGKVEGRRAREKKEGEGREKGRRKEAEGK
jgi:hypothetical protein